MATLLSLWSLYQRTKIVEITLHLVIQSDLFGMVKWPFQGIETWPPTRGWSLGTLNHLNIYLTTGWAGLRGLDPFGWTWTWCRVYGWGLKARKTPMLVGIRFVIASTKPVNLPALQKIPKVPTKPGKKGPKYVHTCDSRGYFYIRKGSVSRYANWLNLGISNCLSCFQLNDQTIEITRFGLRLHLFMNSHEFKLFLAFFCSLQNWWGRGIPNSENLFSIPLNFCLRNAEQLEDFVSEIFLCPFVGGETFEIWQLPGGWEKNWGPFVYTDPGYGLR